MFKGTAAFFENRLNTPLLQIHYGIIDKRI